MGNAQPPERFAARVLWLKAALLVVWATATFVFSFFARDLQFVVLGWPFDYWMGAQGAVIAFIAIVVIYATAMKRLAPQDSVPDASGGPHV